jgi:isopenicillin N synthase-like dioxygenase
MSIATLRQVPVLSLSNYLSGSTTDKLIFVDNLYRGLVDYGFIILEDHPVDQKKVDQAYSMMHEFFHLPLELKLKYADEKSKKQRGYIPFGLEHAKDNPNPDLKEFWHTGREIPANHEFKKYYPDNVWPTEMPELKSVQMALYNAMDMTSKILLDAIGQSLDLPENYFWDMVQDGNSILRTIYYPPVKGLDTKNSVRAAPHGDINLITMLVGATDSGLELLDRDGTWLPVNSKPGQIVVDTGDMMARITNEKMPATIHRVVNPTNSESARYSMPYFVHPQPEALLTCLPSCVGNGPKYPDITSQEFLFERLRAIGLM